MGDEHVGISRRPQCAVGESRARNRFVSSAGEPLGAAGQVVPPIH